MISLEVGLGWQRDLGSDRDTIAGRNDDTLCKNWRGEVEGELRELGSMMLQEGRHLRSGLDEKGKHRRADKRTRPNLAQTERWGSPGCSVPEITFRWAWPCISSFMFQSLML